MLTTRFIDGLRDDIRAVVLVHRPQDLDTASSLALLQEDAVSQAPRREFRRSEGMGFHRKQTPLPLPSPPTASAAVTRPANAGFAEEKRMGSQSRNKVEDDKLSMLRSYRKAKSLCFKCGERWSHSHRCSTSVPLHLVEEMWALVQEEEALQDSLDQEPAEAGAHEEYLMAISRQAVKGSEGKKTIRLKGIIHCQDVLMIVDSGSSASFIGSHLMGLFPSLQKLEQPSMSR